MFVIEDSKVRGILNILKTILNKDGKHVEAAYVQQALEDIMQDAFYIKQSEHESERFSILASRGCHQLYQL